jgi:hypothetical protein
LVITERFTSLSTAPAMAFSAASASPERVPGAPELGSRRPKRLRNVWPVPTKFSTCLLNNPSDT